MSKIFLFTNRQCRASARNVNGFVALIAALGALAGCNVGTDGRVDTDPGDTGSGDACRGSVTNITYDDRLSYSGGTVAGLCLPVSMSVNEYDMAPCAVIEARAVGASSAAACNQCNDAGRAPLNETRQSMVDQIKAEHPSAGLDCFCEIQQVQSREQSEAQSPCQTDPSSAPVYANGDPVDGFCYVAPNDGIGDSSQVDVCPEDEKQMLRFVGAGVPVSPSEVYFTCVTTKYHPPSPECAGD